MRVGVNQSLTMIRHLHGTSHAASTPPLDAALVGDRVEFQGFPHHPAEIGGASIRHHPGAAGPSGRRAGMSDSAKDTRRADPIIDRAERISGAGRLIVLACALVGVAFGFAMVERTRAEPFVLGLLGILAVIGVFTLFAGAIGLIRFAGRSQGNDLGRAFIDAMGEGVVVSDRDGRITYANRAYADMTGAETERDVRAVERVFAGDNAAAEAIYRLAQALRDGKTAEEEIRMPVPLAGAAAGEGGAHWYRVRARPIALRSSKQALTAWTVADVSREKARQETVFQELQHAIDYLDHAPAGFFSAEPDGRIVYLNATLAEWLGVDLARFEAGSLKLADIVRGDGVALLAAAPTDRRNRTDIIDLDLVKKNGQSLPVRLLHRVPLAADGAPGATRTVVLNRSPGEETSEALRASEVRFTRFFNNPPIAIAAVDRRGRIGRTNAPFLRLFGPGAVDFGGGRRRLVELVRENDRPKLEEALVQAAAGASEIPPIDAFMAAAGDRSARFYVNPVEDAAGDEEAVIINAIDITEQRALEQQFAQSQKMQAVGQLAGGVAHDFNNVLTAIIGFSDLLLTNHRPSDPSFQDIMNIKQNANRAAGLVRQLLAFSRRQTLRPQVLVLGEVLADLSILLTRLLGENVKLQLVHGRDLWPIKADLNQFETVIINLAVNARDAMPNGGTMTIRTRNLTAAEAGSFGYHPLPAADYALIEVEDTGTGMTAEVQAKAFEPFFSTKEVGKGTGLGLSTVYGIIKQSGAHIFFTSVLGKGTVFRIFMPRYILAEGEKIAGAVVEANVEIADLTGSATILLVEDEEAVRAFAARALASRGYKVYEAASGIEALEVMKEAGGHIDLIVSDVVMPELDGPSLLRELRKTRPELKIIFVSGYAEEAFRKNLPEGEVFHFLPKPFSLKQLAIAVKETLGR
jgi:two-component system cell cycle sensor histidine kinase/response regulator CckA